MSNYDNTKPIIALIVPTGIGACIGGYAGDASQIARLFASEFNVIVNPNVVNAACFSGITDNMLYTEGFALSEFFKGNLALVPSQNNKIGIIFDRGISQGIINVHINTMNAVKMIYGSDIIGYEITGEPCCISFYNTKTGNSTGNILNNETLVRAGHKLLQKGATVIAVVCKFNEAPEDDYVNGNGVDIVGGIEAVISHYLTRELRVPVVHSPAFEDISITKNIVSPKSAAEYITPTFLPCLLIALKNAPLYSLQNVEQYIYINNLKALIMPCNALGSSIVLNATQKNVKVYAIKENCSILNISKEIIKKDEITEMSTYEECFKLLKENLK